MKWPAATAVLLGLLVAVCSWIYFRDYDANWHPPEPQAARADAETLLVGLRGWHCNHRCVIARLVRTKPERWFTRLVLPHGPACFEIEVNRFVFHANAGGFSGVAQLTCAAG